MSFLKSILMSTLFLSGFSSCTFGAIPDELLQTGDHSTIEKKLESLYVPARRSTESNSLMWESTPSLLHLVLRYLGDKESFLQFLPVLLHSMGEGRLGVFQNLLLNFFGHTKNNAPISRISRAWNSTYTYIPFSLEVRNNGVFQNVFQKYPLLQQEESLTVLFKNKEHSYNQRKSSFSDIFFTGSLWTGNERQKALKLFLDGLKSKQEIKRFVRTITSSACADDILKLNEISPEFFEELKAAFEQVLLFDISGFFYQQHLCPLAQKFKLLPDISDISQEIEERKILLKLLQDSYYYQCLLPFNITTQLDNNPELQKFALINYLRDSSNTDAWEEINDKLSQMINNPSKMIDIYKTLLEKIHANKFDNSLKIIDALFKLDPFHSKIIINSYLSLVRDNYLRNPSCKIKVARALIDKYPHQKQIVLDDLLFLLENPHLGRSDRKDIIEVLFDIDPFVYKQDLINAYLSIIEQSDGYFFTKGLAAKSLFVLDPIIYPLQNIIDLWASPLFSERDGFDAMNALIDLLSVVDVSQKQSILDKIYEYFDLNHQNLHSFIKDTLYSNNEKIFCKTLAEGNVIFSVQALAASDLAYKQLAIDTYLSVMDTQSFREGLDAYNATNSRIMYSDDEYGEGVIHNKIKAAKLLADLDPSFKQESINVCLFVLDSCDKITDKVKIAKILVDLDSSFQQKLVDIFLTAITENTSLPINDVVVMAESLLESHPELIKAKISDFLQNSDRKYEFTLNEAKRMTRVLEALN